MHAAAQASLPVLPDRSAAPAMDPAMVTLWFKAIDAGHLGRLQAFLYDEPRLVLATLDGASTVHKAAIADNGPVLTWLIAQGAPADRTDPMFRDNQTALGWAAAFRKTNAVQALLDAGANASAQDAFGWTPLHRAAAENDEGIARLLLKHGAVQDLVNDQGETPLQTALAMNNPRVVEVLQDAWVVFEREVLTAVMAETPRARSTFERARL